MKTVLRNLLSVLRRFKLATLLNLLGLSVAFTAFMLIMMQWDYDHSFDRFHKNADCIFRVEACGEEGGQAIVCRPLMDAFAESSPHIQALALVDPWWSSNGLFFSIEDEEGNRKNFREPYYLAYPSLVDVFHFEMVEGNDRALESPGQVLISQGIARKLFGNAPAVGKPLMTSKGAYTVGGVYKDFPENSTLKNAIYHQLGDANLNGWGAWNYNCYVRLDDPSQSEALFDHFKKNATNNNIVWENVGTLRLTPLTELHYVTDVTYDNVPKSSRQTLLVLFTISLVIVLIAGINFTNFSTALTPMRIRSINTQKVFGGQSGTIRMALVIEAVAIALVAFLLALFGVEALADTSVAKLLDADMSLKAHPVLLLLTLGLALLTGVLAGIYPSYYMTSFQPALVLKGNFGLSPKGRKMRNVLIGIQFIASFALIVSSLFMYLQNYYMQHTPLGYEKDALIITNLTGDLVNKKEVFSNQLKSHSSIADVTFAEMLLSSSDQYMGWGGLYRNEEISFQCLPVDYSFLKVMGVEISEGRDFREEDDKSIGGVYIFNEKAKHLYDMVAGERVDSAEIAGFIPDVKFASFRTEVTPMAFYVWGTNRQWRQTTYAYIKVNPNADLREAMTHVQTTLKSFNSEYPFDVRFFDEVLDQLYRKELNLTSLITLFSLTAVFISIVGVFGLVVFDSEYRKKEIGIRKVLGSTTGEILVMFNKGYIRILLICFVLAAPMAWYGISRWLENFAYKTPMYLWVYLVAFLIVTFITVCTVTFQNWRAANANPVESIKSE